MKVLTISQPFASLIASGEKWIENRCWRTYYRGPLAIHAGLGRQYLDRASLAAYPTSRIVAVCDLVACLSWDKIDAEAHAAGGGTICPDGRENRVDRTWREIWDHEHCEGPWCWILANVRQVESGEIRGAQGLWDLPPDVAVALQAATK